jgi:hypothetical protein
MSENLAVILTVVCVITVVLAGTFAGMYRLDRAVDETALTPHPHPAE